LLHARAKHATLHKSKTPAHIHSPESNMTVPLWHLIN
jgi:hypothetical protein